MIKAKYPAFVFVAILIFAIALPIIYYPKLPDQVASHFGVTGKADGWTARNTFLIIQIATMMLTALVFGISAFFVTKMPKSLMNFPNKDYWLSEENKEETHTLIQRFLFWFGSITLGFLTLIFMEAVRANLSGSNSLGERFWIYLGVYLLLTIYYTVKFSMHFRKKKITQEPGKDS